MQGGEEKQKKEVQGKYEKDHHTEAKGTAEGVAENALRTLRPDTVSWQQLRKCCCSKDGCCAALWFQCVERPAGANLQGQHLPAGVTLWHLSALVPPEAVVETDAKGGHAQGNGYAHRVRLQEKQSVVEGNVRHGANFVC